HQHHNLAPAPHMPLRSHVQPGPLVPPSAPPGQLSQSGPAGMPGAPGQHAQLPHYADPNFQEPAPFQGQLPPQISTWEQNTVGYPQPQPPGHHYADAYYGQASYDQYASQYSGYLNAGDNINYSFGDIDRQQPAYTSQQHQPHMLQPPQQYPIPPGIAPPPPGVAQITHPMHS